MGATQHDAALPLCRDSEKKLVRGVLFTCPTGSLCACDARPRKAASHMYQRVHIQLPLCAMRPASQYTA
jgi:hypothetical protein